jgi:hypothetical protein
LTVVCARCQLDEAEVTFSMKEGGKKKTEIEYPLLRNVCTLQSVLDCCVVFVLGLVKHLLFFVFKSESKREDD